MTRHTTSLPQTSGPMDSTLRCAASFAALAIFSRALASSRCLIRRTSRSTRTYAMNESAGNQPGRLESTSDAALLNGLSNRSATSAIGSGDAATRAPLRRDRTSIRGLVHSWRGRDVDGRCGVGAPTAARERPSREWPAGAIETRVRVATGAMATGTRAR